MELTRFACLLSLIAASIGCAARPIVPTVPAAWIQQNGGLCHNQALEIRAQRLTAQLFRAIDCATPPNIRILDNSSIAAFSWPSGEIFVSRQLLDQCDDDELAAGIAHEMGHLLSEGRLLARHPAALRGTGRDIESNADRAALQVLLAANIDRGALLRLLQRIEKSLELSPSKAISRRIHLLQTDP